MTVNFNYKNIPKLKWVIGNEIRLLGNIFLFSLVDKFSVNFSRTILCLLCKKSLSPHFLVFKDK